MAASGQTDVVLCDCQCEDPTKLIRFDSSDVLDDDEGFVQCHCQYCGPEDPMVPGRRRCTMDISKSFVSLSPLYGIHPGYCYDCVECNRIQRIWAGRGARKRKRETLKSGASVYDHEKTAEPFEIS